MIGNTEMTTATTRKTNLFSKARKLLLGVGGLAVAGVLMGASPAMARDRFDDHARIIEHREVRVWIPARYEFQTRCVHGRTFSERVLIEGGHWVIR